MNYLVIEMQTNGDQTAQLVTKFDNLNAAESDYYRVLSAAAVSEVPVHAASLLTERGSCLKSDYYLHHYFNEATGQYEGE